MVDRVEKWVALKYNILRRWAKLGCNVAVEEDNKEVFAEIASKTLCDYSKPYDYEDMVDLIFRVWCRTEFKWYTNNTWKFVLIDLAIKEFKKISSM
jgi:hypothetical protein